MFFISGHFEKGKNVQYRRGTAHFFWLKELNTAFKVKGDFWSSESFDFFEL